MHKPGLSPINPSLSGGTSLQEQIRWIIWETGNHSLVQEEEPAHISPHSLSQELQRGHKHHSSEVRWGTAVLLRPVDLRLLFGTAERCGILGWSFSGTRASVHWEADWQGWNGWVCLFSHFTTRKSQTSESLDASLHGVKTGGGTDLKSAYVDKKRAYLKLITISRHYPENNIYP